MAVESGIKLIIQAENEANEKIKTAQEMADMLLIKACEDASEIGRAMREEFEKDLCEAEINQENSLKKIEIDLNREVQIKIEKLLELNVDEIVDEIVKIISCNSNELEN